MDSGGDPLLLADLIFQWHDAPFCTLMEAARETTPDDRIIVMSDSISNLPTVISDHDPRPCESIVKFPPVVMQKEDVLASVSPSCTPPVVQQTRSKREGSKCKGKCKGMTRARLQAADRLDSTHAEHIIRERQRRDDMTAKYLVLESLLLPSPKRERSAIVEDTILLVQGLQHKKAQLLKRQAELKLKIVRPSLKTPSPSPTLEGHDEFGSSTSAINVHVAGKDGVVVEIMWNQPPPNFHSVLLHVVENMGMDVTRCRVARVASHGSFVQCFVTCSKPHVPSSQVHKESILASENVIMGGLRNMLTQFS